jgi:hypothetical protein
MTHELAKRVSELVTRSWRSRVTNDETRDELGQALYDVLYVLHRAYPNTGITGGVEGRVMNTYCFVNTPYTPEDSEILERVERVALEWMRDKNERSAEGVHKRSHAVDPGGARYDP